MEPKPDDAVESFLQSRPPVAQNASLEEQLLAQTTRVLRRRRVLRRARMATIFAGVFLAGAASAWLVKPAPMPPEPADQPSHAAPAVKEDAPPQSAKDNGKPAASAWAEEWRAFDARADRTRLFREAGDRYLAESQDVEAALRCYTQALDAGGDDALAVAPQDSWLLIALKDARRKEKARAFADN